LAFQAAKLVQSLFPAWQVSGEADNGSPVTELITRADEWGADLIVVGSHGRSALGRFILGSVAQKVVTEAAP
jgi:nucleotide-binding universal stress UspA family protein